MARPRPSGPRRSPDSALLPRLRVVHRDAIALGPGKVALLEAVAARGTLAAAARLLDMSYMRAWQLLRVTNAAFRAPLVDLSRGGRDGGGARLTPLGAEVVALYREMERRSLAACASEWRRLRRRLR